MSSSPEEEIKSMLDENIARLRLDDTPSVRYGILSGAMHHWETCIDCSNSPDIWPLMEVADKEIDRLKSELDEQD